MAGSDADHLIGSLERLRATLRWKADGLDAAGLGTTIGASAQTIGGLLKHLAAVEDHVMTVMFAGEQMRQRWRDMDWDGTNDWELLSARD